MKKFFGLILVICSATVLFCLLGGPYKLVSEHNVEHYFSDLSIDGLTKLGIYGLGEHVELYTWEAQEEILNHLSKIEATMGGLGSNTKELGGILLKIVLFYADGQEEVITLPAFTYPTLLGDRDFFLTIDGESALEQRKIWDPFRKYFNLLQS